MVSKQQQTDVEVKTYEASSQDYSNAFYNNEIRLFQIGDDPSDPRYELRDMRNPRIYPNVSLPGDDYLSLGKVRRKVFHTCGIVPFPGLEQKDWIALIGKKADEIETIKVHLPDYSLERLILESVLRWFEQRQEGEAYSDIQSGSYLERDYHGTTYWWFHQTPVRRWLKRDLDRLLPKRALADHLQCLGLVSSGQRVKGASNPVRLWGIEKMKLQEYIYAEEEKQEELDL